MENNQQQEKKSNPLTWVIVAIIIIVIAAGAYYFLTQDEDTNTNNTNVVANNNANTAANENVNTTSNTNSITAHDELLYSNEEHGFQLEFPEEWKGYSTEIWDGYFSDPDNLTDHVFIRFRHPQVMSSDGLPGVVSFQIAITDDSEAELYPYFNLLKTSEEGIRYSYRVGSGASPGDLGQFSKQIPNIKSTFEIK